MHQMFSFCNREQETVEHLFPYIIVSQDNAGHFFSEHYGCLWPQKINSLLDVWQTHKTSLNRYVGLFPFAYYGCLAGKEKDML